MVAPSTAGLRGRLVAASATASLVQTRRWGPFAFKKGREAYENPKR